MKIIVVVFMVFSSFAFISAQDKNDLDLIKNHLAQYQPKKLSVIKSQFPQEKYFEKDFYQFSKSSFKQFPFHKAFFVSTDRLMRGGRLAFLLAPMRRRNTDGKIIDHISYYTLR